MHVWYDLTSSTGVYQACPAPMGALYQNQALAACAYFSMLERTSPYEQDYVHVDFSSMGHFKDACTVL